MDKNIKLIFCILTSILLAMLNNPIFSNAKLGLWLDKGYGTSIFGVMIHSVTNIISFIGFLLTIFFTILLLVNNIKSLMKDKE